MAQRLERRQVALRVVYKLSARVFPTISENDSCNYVSIPVTIRRASSVEIENLKNVANYSAYHTARATASGEVNTISDRRSERQSLMVVDHTGSAVPLPSRGQRRRGSDVPDARSINY
ncbi:hypothetical protein KGM_209140 [Danaus plexippus plexippus]|uniref:Uncharacterized protein n=1 Tax=Danaus plexippus plexippus TaxID=278856 RepID=A0A212F836_DANPL|nr:hypothetical protein KGM_209140 [Danaus plexippus plexippus]